MQKTERLYFDDSGLLEFSGIVVDIRPSDRGDCVVLDRTAFYPTGGGQPNDVGELDGARVVDVFEDDQGVIYHLVSGTALLEPGQSVMGRIDRARRLDHLQQHSGQHILSQAFIQVCGAETRSFHLGERTSTIDIDLAVPTDDVMRAAEDVANGIVFEDRPMVAHMVTEQGARTFPLRKESQVKGEIRIIEVQDFDWSPCGGTHARRTGQVGMIAVRSFERAKKLTRVEFVCGGRALREYREAREVSFAAARLFSAERGAVPDLVERALQENKALKRRLKELAELAMTAEAAEALASVEAADGFKVVEGVFDGRELDEIKILAAKIVQREPAIALLATRDGGATRLVFARSASLPHDMGKLLAEACALLGGRGGGRPDLAQGGCPTFKGVEAAIRAAGQALKSTPAELP